MYAGKLIFSQIINRLPMHRWRQCAARYQGDHQVKRFQCLDQYPIIAFAQLTHQESLRMTRLVYSRRPCSAANQNCCHSMQKKTWQLTLTIGLTRWMHQSSIYACPYAHGHYSVQPSLL